MIPDTNNLIYVYCITFDKPSQLELFGAGKLQQFEHNSLYITVKIVSKTEFSEENIKKNISNEEWLEIHVREHVSVIEKIMETQAVIPFNFGTIYKSEDSLKQFVEKYSDDLRKTLQYLKNKEEWSAKIYCDKNKIIKNIAYLSNNMSDIELLIKNSSPGKAYLLGKKKKEILEKEISIIYNNYSKKIFTTLNDLSEEYRLNTLLSNDITGKEEDMIVNATFLIKKESIHQFIEVVNVLCKEYENIGIIVNLTGPWPPYSFIKISE